MKSKKQLSFSNTWESWLDNIQEYISFEIAILNIHFYIQWERKSYLSICLFNFSLIYFFKK